MDSQHRVVSSEDEQLILVDRDDNEIGYRSKAECHDGDGVLHRAFSIFLFNDAGELLLQKRAAKKRLWPGYWSNSICSHPRRGESLQIATARRLDDELGVEASLERVYHFCYRARFGEPGSEHELCHVFLGRLHGEIGPNRNEIDAVRLIERGAVDGELRDNADKFTPWFRQEWRTLSEDYSDYLDRYAI